MRLGLFRKPITNPKWYQRKPQQRASSEEEMQKFFRFAVMLGADPATRTRSQFVRMLDGTRQSSETLPVFYLDPGVARLGGTFVYR